MTAEAARPRFPFGLTIVCALALALLSGKIQDGLARPGTAHGNAGDIQ